MRRSRALRSLAWSQLDLRASGPLLRSVDVGSPVCPRGWRGQGAGAEEESWVSVGQGERKVGPATGGGGHGPPRSHSQLHSLDRADSEGRPQTEDIVSIRSG